MITDIPAGTASDGSSTPAGDADDDFFSSWDKPSIKRPSNPPSRTGTPPVVSRTASPFLNAGANGNGARSKSPLSASDKEASSPAPTAVRASASVRKASSTTTAKKGSVLGAKKAPKLGAKKIGGAEAIDFEEAERKAKEEAERIEKLGYDPEAEQAEADTKAKTSTAATAIASPTPISPRAGGFGSTSKAHERSASEVERLGMGIGRLGFGQTVGAKPAAPKKLGFGSVAPVRSAEEGLFYLRSLDQFRILTKYQRRNWSALDPDSVARRVSRRTSSSDGIASTLMRRQKLKSDSASLKGQPPSRAMPTLVVRKMISLLVMTLTAILRVQPRISFAASVSRLVMIWKI